MIDLVSETEPTLLDLLNLFGRFAPLHVDLGCGDGSFLRDLAAEYPTINFLGIERLLRRVRSSTRKGKEVSNVRVIRSETIFGLRRLLPAESVDAFYLLFPDPWPKRRHHRRRLVTAQFLDAIRTRLTENGSLFIATDHHEYFIGIRDLSAKTAGFRTTSSEWMLPASTFEKRFLAAGAAIHRIELRKVSPLR